MENIEQPRYFFVINPLCFQGGKKLYEIIECIHNFFVNAQKNYAVHISRFPRDAIGAINKFAKAAPDISLRVYAVGGDGILFDCLNGSIGLPNVELGIIPYGSSKDFYRLFGTDINVLRSLDAQIKAPSVLVDALHCGSNYALNYCLIGLDALANAEVIRLFDNSIFKKPFLKIARKFSVYNKLLNGIANPEILEQTYKMWVDDKDWGGRHAFINIANSPGYEDSLSAVPEAVPDDGFLDVLASVGKVDVLSLRKIIKKYVRGQHAEYPENFLYQRAKKVFITSSSPLILDMDGEIFYDKYISVTIKPEMVRIITPTEQGE